MKGAVPLAEASEPAVFGSKAVGLGQAIRDGLPVPPGVALSGAVVEAVASGDERTIERLEKAVRHVPPPFAVRSSAVDEDGAAASFAGQHLTLLNVGSVGELAAALREVWWSANSDSAITYRQRVGLFARPSVGVVVQSLLDPDVAGVMFTCNPVTGEDERVVEASWGLGEAVVAGLVIPDHFRVDRSGAVLERTPGRKSVAVRRLADGGTSTEQVDEEQVSALCLDDGMLQALNDLALRCEQTYGPGRDIEWAVAGGTLYLLQCRAVTTAGGPDHSPASQPAGGRIEALRRVELFAGLDSGEIEQIAERFKERRFAKGEIVIREGSGGAALYLVDSGTADVTVRGSTVATLGPGDHFGEIALIDEGPRAATVMATSDLVCYGLTLWEFRPLVQENGVIAWKLLQSMVKLLRAAESDRGTGGSGG
jgi:pyruvate,water dikinase